MLIIDTEQYSGNFEREMCAHITGQVGECNVGYDVAEEYSEKIEHVDWWKERIVSESDPSGYGCHWWLL